MRFILLMRHANALFPEPGQSDFDRNLSPKGIEEAKDSAAQIMALGLTPQKIICSPANRAQQTLDAIQSVFQSDDITVDHDAKLYSGGADNYLKQATSQGATTPVMLVGHNPMIEDCALALSQTGDADSLYHLRSGFRTAAVAVFSINDAGKATLEHMIGAY